MWLRAGFDSEHICSVLPCDKENKPTSGYVLWVHRWCVLRAVCVIIFTPHKFKLHHHEYSWRALPSSGSFLADASRSATLAANDTCLLDSCWRLLALRAFLSAFRFLFCISFSYTAHLFSCWVRRFWAARSLSRLGTLSSCCSSWISSRWLAMAPGGGTKVVDDGGGVKFGEKVWF